MSITVRPRKSTTKRNQTIAYPSYLSFLNPPAQPQVAPFQNPMSPLIKLTYFPFMGLGELPRLILHFGGVAFEDNRINPYFFPVLKSTLPLGQLPVLEVEGKMYSQSMAIARYAAKVAGLSPEDPLQALEIDMISETIKDLHVSLIEMYRIREVNLRSESVKKYLESTLPTSFIMLEKKVEGPFFLGDTATYADIQLYVLLRFFDDAFDGVKLSEFPKLLSVSDQVEVNPGVAAYLVSQSH